MWTKKQTNLLIEEISEVQDQIYSREFFSEGTDSRLTVSKGQIKEVCVNCQRLIVEITKPMNKWWTERILSRSRYFRLQYRPNT